MNTKDVVLAYHDAFHKNDLNSVRTLLKEDGTFTGPLNSFNDADAFLESAAIFMKLSQNAKVKTLITEGDNACLYYDYETKVPSVGIIPIASVFKVQAGKIEMFHTHFNPISFVKAKENGDVAKTLQSLV